MRFKRTCGKQHMFGKSRTGAAAVEEVLVLSVALPLAALIVFFGIRILVVVSDVMFVLMSAPFLVLKQCT